VYLTHPKYASLPKMDSGICVRVRFDPTRKGSFRTLYEYIYARICVKPVLSTIHFDFRAISAGQGP
jgi:hypothetical protein